MISSMTGFGRGEFTRDNRTVIIEMKSVNHRYCDINIRLPRKLNFIENIIKNKIKGTFERGKIDVFINYEDRSETNNQVVFNEALAKNYLDILSGVAHEFSLENDIRISTLSRYPEVMGLEEVEQDESLLEEITLQALEIAMQSMKEARSKEGAFIQKDLQEKLHEMAGYVQDLEMISPLVVAEYKEKFEKRVTELLEKPIVDDTRIAMEVAVFTDKSCIDEEIVRLQSHVQHMKDTLHEEVSVGRKLDFIAQEMNREANTVLSKANNVKISNQGIELKTLIEKIREQIQNIE